MEFWEPWLKVRTLPFDAWGEGFCDGLDAPVAAKSVAVRSVPEWSGVPSACAPPNSDELEYLSFSSGVQEVQKEFGNRTLLYATCY